jgi:hypothetical protein
MPDHDYTPAKALSVLLEKLVRADESLAARVKSAINAGKDIQKEEPALRRRKRPRVYRKNAPYSDEEAIDVALGVLKAHFVELPRTVNAVGDSFKKTAIGPKRNLLQPKNEDSRWEDVGSIQDRLLDIEKNFEIEIERETTQAKEQVPNAKVKRYDEGAIQEIDRLLAVLHSLLNFQPESNAHTTTT